MILDASGNPIEEGQRPERCPTCGLAEKRFISHKMFGGYWKTVCPQCGTVIASGQGNVPDGIT